MAKAQGITVRPNIFRDKVRPKEEWDGVKVGRTTGLKVTHFLPELFVANERANLTDEALANIVAAEFPKRCKAKNADGTPMVLQSIAAYRGYFNSGKHGFNPDKAHGHSSSYNAEGVARARSEGNGKPKGKASKGKPAVKGKGKPAAKAGKPKAVKAGK